MENLPGFACLGKQPQVKKGWGPFVYVVDVVDVIREVSVKGQNPR